MFLCYVTITDMSLTVKNASSDVEFDISEYFIYFYFEISENATIKIIKLCIGGIEATIKPFCWKNIQEQ